MRNKGEVFSHLLVTFIYFLIVSVLRFKLDWNLLGLWAGAFLGTFFLDIDHVIYWFIAKTEAEDSKEAREIIRNVRDIRGIGGIIKKLYFLLQRVHFSHTRLIFHSVVGQGVLLILAFYLITSGGSLFGSAFIMAINLHLLKDEWQDYQKDKKHLADWLFWQVRGFSEKNLKVYLLIVSLVFLWVSLLML